MVDYDAWLRIGLSVDIVSGIVFLLFGLFAALKRPRTKAGRAAAVFALGWALIGIYPNYRILSSGINPGLMGSAGPVVHAFHVLGFTCVAAGALWLGRIMVGRWPRNPIGTGVLSIGVVAVGITAFNTVRVAPSLGISGSVETALFSASTSLAGLVAPVLLWLAIVVPTREPKGRLVALAVTPLAGAWFLAPGVQFVHDGRWAPVVTMSLALALSLPGLARRREPRLLAWTMTWWFGSLLWGWMLVGHHPNDLGLIGFTRLLAVGIMVYAVVRHRAFDIDIKLRFTLRQSTIAAIFVAVFVAVQAGVGEFVTASAGILAGAAATALLVFALGPIQRFAEQLAASTMPRAVPLEERSTDDRRRLYEALAREAWSDGSINAKEARVLETAWRRLGLSAEQAAVIDGRVRS